MARDFQRSKVYAAERAAFQAGNSKVGTPALFGAHDLSVPESQAFVDKVIGSAWFARQFVKRDKDPKILVVAQHGGGARSYSGMYHGRIHASGWGRREWVLLHEISHNVVSSLHPAAPWHGWEFCSVYLKLVKHHLGADAAAALKAAFKAGKVKHAAPRPKRQLSPEQAEKARENLAKIRARKAAEKAAAEAANPLKVKVERKGDFSIKHTFGVKVEILDRSSGDLLWSTGDDVVWSGGSSHLMSAGDAREFGVEKATGYAQAWAGHEIAVHITGRAKGWRGAFLDDKAEVITVRFDAELAEAAA